MAEKQYKYTAAIKQPQTVVNIKLDPKGGKLTEREYKAVKKDHYGASLLEKGLLLVEETPEPDADEQNSGDTIPDFDSSSESSE